MVLFRYYLLPPKFREEMLTFPQSGNSSTFSLKYVLIFAAGTVFGFSYAYLWMGALRWKRANSFSTTESRADYSYAMDVKKYQQNVKSPNTALSPITYEGNTNYNYSIRLNLFDISNVSYINSQFWDSIAITKSVLKNSQSLYITCNKYIIQRETWILFFSTTIQIYKWIFIVHISNGSFRYARFYCQILIVWKLNNWYGYS